MAKNRPLSQAEVDAKLSAHRKGQGLGIRDSAKGPPSSRNTKIEGEDVPRLDRLENELDELKSVVEQLLRTLDSMVEDLQPAGARRSAKEKIGYS